MGRIVFLLSLAFAVWFFFKSWQRKQLNTRSGGAAHQNGKIGRQPQEEIFSCLHCGAYSPMSEGLMIRGHFYCGIEHAKAAGEKLG